MINLSGMGVRGQLRAKSGVAAADLENWGKLSSLGPTLAPVLEFLQTKENCNLLSM